MRRALLAATLILAGCSGSTAPGTPPEFVLQQIPSASLAYPQGMDMYEITGHGKRCYVAAFGVSKVLLWCEEARDGR